MTHLDLLILLYCAQKEKCYLLILPVRKPKLKETFQAPTAHVWERQAVPWGLLGSAPLLKAYTPTCHYSPQRPAREPECGHLLQELGSQKRSQRTESWKVSGISPEKATPWCGCHTPGTCHFHPPRPASSGRHSCPGTAQLWPALAGRWQRDCPQRSLGSGKISEEKKKCESPCQQDPGPLPGTGIPCVLQEQLPLTSTEALCREKDSSKEGSRDLSLGAQKCSSSEVAKVTTSPKMQETLLNVCLTGDLLTTLPRLQSWEI